MLTDFLLLLKQELLLTAIIFILVFLKLSSKELDNARLLTVVNILLTLNLIAGFFNSQTGNLFGDMFSTNPLLIFEKNLLNFGTLIISLQSYDWLMKHKHVVEFYVLLLSSLLGIFLMLASNNLLMFYLSLELSTIPLAALSNFDLGKRRSSEAAFKMIISSAFSSALLLFGISLLYGTTGTLSFAEIPNALTGNTLQLFSFILLLAGFGFKISAVPFHLWTADVYEGSPVAVTSFLSVISKGAVVFVLVSVLYRVFEPLSDNWYNILSLLSLLTMIIGNLFALRQQNMKRFLAFSSIAQIGFVLIGISGQSTEGNASVVFFILIYIFSNLAAFGVINLVSSVCDKESIDDFKGFYKTNPLLTWVLAIALFSLAGIPPTAGFFGKLLLLMAGAAKNNYLLITIAALNMVIALYYYLRVIKAMFMDANEKPIETLKIPLYPKLAMLVCVIGILVVGIYSNCYQYIFSLVK